MNTDEAHTVSPPSPSDSSNPKYTLAPPEPSLYWLYLICVHLWRQAKSKINTEKNHWASNNNIKPVSSSFFPEPPFCQNERFKSFRFNQTPVKVKEAKGRKWFVCVCCFAPAFFQLCSSFFLLFSWKSCFFCFCFQESVKSSSTKTKTKLFSHLHLLLFLQGQFTSHSAPLFHSEITKSWLFFFWIDLIFELLFLLLFLGKTEREIEKIPPL